MKYFLALVFLATFIAKRILLRMLENEKKIGSDLAGSAVTEKIAKPNKNHESKIKNVKQKTIK